MTETEKPMEFLVEFDVSVPEGTPASEVGARTSAEASAAARLVDRGHLVRLWKPPAASGETKALGLYRADSEAQLAGLLAALPLSDWMQITVTPLHPHPNDPAPGGVTVDRLQLRARTANPRTNSTTQETDMSTTEVQTASPDSAAGEVNMNLENQVIPVSDVDRSKQFYESLGWRLDEDVAPMEALRIVQFTPPGSGTSVTFGKGLTTAAPGSAQAVLVVSDIEVAHAELVGRGIDAADVWHGPPFPVEARQPGVDPQRASYGSFSSFNDPDGNVWIVQEITTREAGRVTGAAFASSTDLEAALRRAEAAHSEHEKGTGHRLKAEVAERVRDDEWPAWYASYIVAEQTGTDLPA